MSDFPIPPSLTRLFVTDIYRADLNPVPGFAATLHALDNTCRAMAAEDAAGIEWSRKSGYLGYTSYASIPDITAHAPCFAELKRYLDHHVALYASQIQLDLEGRKLQLVSMWVNVVEPLGTHTGHIHPHCAISGTIYVTTPPGSSPLRFEDPRLGLMMAAPLRHPSARPDRLNFHNILPVAGHVVLWESWLRHEVPLNIAEEVRISISFNYA
ncbi:MAG: hypothetical protein JF615_00155 [Asticcacaulis sp.]|nr:hypothetical protein [Asticcacaulis sp.]